MPRDVRTCGVPRPPLVLLALLAACEPAVPRPIQLDCEDGVCVGTVTPTAVDERVDDVQTAVQGRADHWVCRPARASDHNGGLLVHLVGTASDPSADFRVPEHACSLGWLAVAPAYENRNASRPVCGSEAGDCYERFHREILFGDDDAPTPVDVDGPGSVVTRTRGLLDALAEDDPFDPWADAAAAFADDNLTQVALSGHSQGNGHALYWAREREVERVVLLAGVADRVRSGEPESDAVPWVAAFSEVTATPADRVASFLHVDEDGVTPVEDSRANLDALGVGEAVCDFETLPREGPCPRIEIGGMDCGAGAAHITPVLRTFGDGCRLGGDAHDVRPAWDLLLAR